MGATWATEGRFGGALRFHGSGDVVRVPAAGSLNLRSAISLAAWVRPSAHQSGWRTVLARQTDSYFLMAGGGTHRRVGAPATRRGAPCRRDTLVLSHAGPWSARGISGQRRAWWPPVWLFLAGSLVDVALAPSGTLVGPTLVAAWCGLTASNRLEAASMYLITLLFAGVTVVSLVGHGGIELARHDGGIARSMAIGLLLVTAGLFAARDGRSGRGSTST